MAPASPCKLVCRADPRRNTSIGLPKAALRPPFCLTEIPMALLNINALGVTLGDHLFNDLTLTISKGDRIGLVAANGRGKTTLLECLAGMSDQTTGEIIRTRG